MCSIDIHTDKRYTYLNDKMGGKNKFKFEKHSLQLQKDPKTAKQSQNV